MTEATLQTEWARVIAESLRHAGVDVVFASPGSRSTPFLAGMLRAELRVHDVVDERTAAFAALGHARASGEPAAVLCTSGTAPAHWFPAVLEASLAGVPLLLLSADRPTELSLCGAPQTVDQTKLFGAHVRFFADPGNPDAGQDALAGLRRVVGQAVSASRGPSPGPVQLNVRARKPLEPREPTTSAEHALRARADRVLARPLARARGLVGPSHSDLQELAGRLASAERPLFVAGPLPCTLDPQPVHELVRRLGGALMAESTSQLRYVEGAARCDTLGAWLAAGLFQLGASDLSRTPEEAAPDLVVELGGVPTSAAYERWVSRTEPRRIVLGAPAYLDPHASVEQIVLGDLGRTVQALLALLAPRATGASSWSAQLEALDRRGLAIAAEHAQAWGEPAIARTLASQLPASARLVIGNSLPIRMLDRFGGRDTRRSPISVLHQRGANGIDGLVAQSFGASLVGTGPTVALLGDLTLLHDVGALSLVRRAASPLVIVAVDNGGGRIFETLPVAREAAWMMPHMVTEESVDHDALSHAFGIRHARVESTRALGEALEAGLRRAGATLVTAVVPPHGAASLEASLATHHATALAEHRSSA